MEVVFLLFSFFILYSFPSFFPFLLLFLFYSKFAYTRFFFLSTFIYTYFLFIIILILWCHRFWVRQLEPAAGKRRGAGICLICGVGSMSTHYPRGWRVWWKLRPEMGGGTGGREF